MPKPWQPLKRADDRRTGATLLGDGLMSPRMGDPCIKSSYRGTLSSILRVADRFRERSPSSRISCRSSMGRFCEDVRCTPLTNFRNAPPTACRWPDCRAIQRARPCGTGWQRGGVAAPKLTRSKAWRRATSPRNITGSPHLVGLGTSASLARLRARHERPRNRYAAERG
jgi:hypothetical protein